MRISVNSRWLYSYMTVIQCGSITSAAKKLFISPQALSQQMDILEEEVGAKLFLRGRKGVELTLAGKEFLSGAQELSAVYARTLSRCRLASNAEKSIRIPMMNSIKLPTFMEAVCSLYVKEHPEAVPPEFITDTSFGGWLDGLVNFKYDIIEHFAVDGLCPQDIYFEELSTVTSYCVISDDHPLAQKKLIKPDDLDGYSLIVPTENLKLSRFLLMYIETRGLHTPLIEPKNDKYEILSLIAKGGVYTADEDIGKLFYGCVTIPLDFDTHIRHGFACRENMRDAYKDFFAIAHRITENAK